MFTQLFIFKIALVHVLRCRGHTQDSGRRDVPKTNDCQIGLYFHNEIHISSFRQGKFNACIFSNLFHTSSCSKHSGPNESSSLVNVDVSRAVSSAPSTPDTNRDICVHAVDTYTLYPTATIVCAYLVLGWRMYTGRVCVRTQRTGAAARESLRQDHPGGPRSPASNDACGSASPFSAHCCHKSQTSYIHHRYYDSIDKITSAYVCN
jgi:hypothetical protein